MATGIRPVPSRIDARRDKVKDGSEISADIRVRHRTFLEAFESDRSGAAAIHVRAPWNEPSSMASFAEIQELFQAFSRITHADVRQAVVQFAVALAPDHAPRH